MNNAMTSAIKRIHKFEKKRILQIILPMLLLIALDLSANSGYRAPPLAIPDAATADAGMAANARDASTSATNPAGMTRLTRSEFIIGVTPLINFPRYGISDETQFTGDKGGIVGGVGVGLAHYIVIKLGDRCRIGISGFTPGALSQNPGRGWKGRFFLQNGLFVSFSENLSFAYKINSKLSIGAGVIGAYGYANNTVAVTDVDRLNLNLDNLNRLAYGYNAGILYQWSPCTRVGITYTSKLRFHLSGKAETTGVNFNQLGKGRTTVPLPQFVIASVRHQFNPCLTLLANVIWEDWSILKKSVISLSSEVLDGLTTTVINNWHKTWELALGLEYRLNRRLLLQAGAAYNTSPQADKYRTPGLFFGQHISWAAGCIYTSNPCETLYTSMRWYGPNRYPIDQVLLGQRFKAKYHAIGVQFIFGYNRKM